MTLTDILLSLAILIGAIMVRLKIRELQDRVDVLERELIADRLRTPVVERPPVHPEPVAPQAPEPPRPAAVPPPLPRPAPVPAPKPVAAPRPPREWESLIGGNILNKIGALVLVIGIALFLGYSFTHMSPAARVAVCCALSASLLGVGVAMERRLALFARGLIGAGWAGLYATAYASHALSAARVIDSPIVASALLTAVAAGMVAHSLRYRSEAVTGVAFFTAFAALAVMPSTMLAVMCLLPLAAALLWVVWRMNWYVIALPGMAATWVLCWMRGDSGVAAEWFVVVIWLMFEAFDLLRLRAGRRENILAWLFPVNAALLITLTYRIWPEQDLWRMAAVGSVLFAASAAARFWLRSMYEGAAGVAAVLCGLAIAGRAEGIWRLTAMAVEAEAVWLLGWRLKSRALRILGGVGFGWSLWNSWPGGSVPTLLLQAAFFWLNRYLARAGKLFSSLAAALIALVILNESPEKLRGVAMLLEAVALFELGVFARATEFRVQAYLLAMIGSMIAAAFATGNPWALAFAVVTVLAAGVRLTLLHSVLTTLERQVIPLLTSGAAAAMGALLVWRVVPEAYVTAAWCAFGLILLEGGVRRLPAALKYAGAVLIAGGCFWAMLAHPNAAVCFACAAAGLGAAGRLWLSDAAADEELRIGLQLAGAATLCLALWTALPLPLVAIAWLGVAVAFLATGERLALASTRTIGHMVAGCAVAWSAWFDRPDSVFSSAGAIAILCGIAWRYRLYTVPAAVLTSALLWTHVSGGMLTIALGTQGLAMLAAGFVARERLPRLQGLGLLLSCILKLFLYDLRNLETLYRIGSFVTLGLILLGVSWIYARFRERFF